MTTSSLPLYLRGQMPALAIALIVLATTGVVKWQASWMPEVAPAAIPQAMPSPNARDDFNAADGLLRDNAAVGNALYQQPNVPSSVTPVMKADWSNPYHVFTLAEKDKLVAENLPAVAKLRAGFGHPYMGPQMRPFAVVPYFANDRGMARVLSLQGQTQAAHGDWDGAMRSYLDAIELGSDLPRGGGEFGMLVGIACDAIGRRPAAAAIDHLTASQAEGAARRLAGIDADPVAPTETLREEKTFTQDALLDLCSKPSWRTTFLARGPAYFNYVGLFAPLPHDMLYDLELRAESPRTAYDNYSRYMDELIRSAQVPWPRDRLAKFPPQAGDPVNQVILPTVTGVELKQFSSLTLDRLLEVQLALRAYRVQHGRYPIALADLTPGYLPVVPLDPFSDNQALRYRLTGSAYLLYSVGPDAVDNGGAPVVDPRNAQDHDYFYVNANATGDIVAGVNG